MRTVLIAAALLASSPAIADSAKLLSYSDASFQDGYTEAVLAPFNDAGGPHRVEFSPSTSSASMLDALRAHKDKPELDVVIMDTTSAAIACAEGLVEKVTPNMLPMLGDLDPQAKDANGCGPGVTFDHFVIAYDTSAVQPAPVSLMDLKDPKWKGKTSLAAPPDMLALAMTAILAHAATGDWRQPGPAIKDLREMAQDAHVFDPQPDAYALLLNDTLAFVTVWNARAQLYHERSEGRIGVMLPREGTVLQINTINLVKGAPHREAGLTFMRYALSPDAQKAFTELTFYGPTNRKAQIAPEVAARTCADAENKSKVIPVDWNEMVKLRDNWTQLWRRDVIQAGER